MTLIYVDANALSCQRLNDRIIAQCQADTCTDVLYVSEIQAFGVCSRRTEIAEPPTWAKKIIEFEFKNSEHSKEQAIVELNLDNSYWNKSFLFEGSDEYLRNRTELKMPLSNFGELRLLEHSSISETKAEWKSIEFKELLIDIAWKIANWLSLIASFIFLIVSIIWFNQWLKGNKSSKWIFSILVGQSLIMGTAILLMMSWGFYLIMIAGLFVPGIWFYQLVYFISNKYRERALGI